MAELDGEDSEEDEEEEMASQNKNINKNKNVVSVINGVARTAALLELNHNSLQRASASASAPASTSTSTSTSTSPTPPPISLKTTLTAGINVFLAGQYKKPKLSEMKDLIRDLGGNLLTKEETTRAVNGSVETGTVYVVCDDSTSDASLGLKGPLLATLQNAIGDLSRSVVLVHYSWLFDSVSQGVLRGVGGEGNEAYGPRSRVGNGLWQIGSLAFKEEEI